MDSRGQRDSPLLRVDSAFLIAVQHHRVILGRCQKAGPGAEEGLGERPWKKADSGAGSDEFAGSQRALS